MIEPQLSSLENSFAAARQYFETEIIWLQGTEAASLSHSQLEERLQPMGWESQRLLLQAHLDLRADQEAALAPKQLTGADGVPRTHRRPTSRTLATLFGLVDVKRLRYSAPGVASLHPLDAALNLPDVLYSHGLQRCMAQEGAQASFDRAVDQVAASTATAVPRRQAELLVQQSAVDFEAFYAQRVAVPDAGGDILALSCDGKGIPMRYDDLRPATQKVAQTRRHQRDKRLSRHEKCGAKRMAEVATVYTIDPFARTAEDLVRELWPDEESAPPAVRPRPQQKRVWASVEQPPEQVIAQAFDEAERRDPEHRRLWVILVDGNQHQLDLIQAELAQRGIEALILLDVIHVLQYLWAAGRVFHPKDHPAAQHWVSHQLWRILLGHSRVVAADMRALATRQRLEPEKREAVDTCANYLRNHAAYLDYPQALAAGMPIATGVIEGACRHLIKDRLEITGARWRLAGAEAVLRLRSLLSSRDFEEYWQFHLQQEFRRHHATHNPQTSPFKAVPVPDRPPELGLRACS